MDKEPKNHTVVSCSGFDGTNTHFNDTKIYYKDYFKFENLPQITKAESTEKEHSEWHKWNYLNIHIESHSKFKPNECGLIKRVDKDGEKEFILLKDDKVIGRLLHVNYCQGLPIEWEARKIVHCIDGSTKDHVVFSGKIPTNAFGKMLIENLFYGE